MANRIQVQLPNGRTIWAAVASDGPSNVALEQAIFKLEPKELHETIVGVSETIRAAIKGLAPDEMSVEFGLELALKTGKLISVLAEASGKASISVTLSWRRPHEEPSVEVAEHALDGDLATEDQGLGN